MRRTTTALVFFLSLGLAVGVHPNGGSAAESNTVRTKGSFRATSPVDAKGWGPFRIGETARSAEKRAGKSYETLGFEDFDGACWYLTPFGNGAPSVMVNAERKGDPGDGIIVRIESNATDAKKPVMAKGLRVGATKAAILKAFPTAKRSAAEYTDGIYLDARLTSTTSIRFELNNGKTADAVFVGTPGAIQYVEGCA
jgi:hypothetical protein